MIHRNSPEINASSARSRASWPETAPRVAIAAFLLAAAFHAGAEEPSVQMEYPGCHPGEPQQLVLDRFDGQELATCRPIDYFSEDPILDPRTGEESQECDGHQIVFTNPITGQETIVCMPTLEPSWDFELPPFCDPEEIWATTELVGSAGGELYTRGVAPDEVHYFTGTRPFIAANVPDCFTTVSEVVLDGQVVPHGAAAAGGEPDAPGDFYEAVTIPLANSRRLLILTLHLGHNNGDGKTMPLEIRLTGWWDTAGFPLELEYTLVRVADVHLSASEDSSPSFVVTEEDLVNGMVLSLNDTFGRFNYGVESVDGNGVCVSDFDFDGMVLEVEPAPSFVSFAWSFKLPGSQCWSQVDVSGRFGIFDIGAIVVLEWLDEVQAEIEVNGLWGLCEIASWFEDVDEAETAVAASIASRIESEIASRFPEDLGLLLESVRYVDGAIHFEMMDSDAVTIRSPYRANPASWEEATALGPGDQALVSVSGTADVCSWDGTVEAPACNSFRASGQGLPNLGGDDPAIGPDYVDIQGTTYYAHGNAEARDASYCVTRILDLPMPDRGVGSLIVRSFESPGTMAFARYAGSLCRVDSGPQGGRVGLNVNDYRSQASPDNPHNPNLYGLPYGGPRDVQLVFPDLSSIAEGVPECPIPELVNQPGF